VKSVSRNAQYLLDWFQLHVNTIDISDARNYSIALVEAGINSVQRLVRAAIDKDDDIKAIIKKKV
jgi:hypothetical protein